MKESGGLVADAVGPGLRIVVDTANPVGAADVRTRIAVEPLVDTADIEECTLGRTARGEVELVGNVTALHPALGVDLVVAAGVCAKSISSRAMN